MNYTFKILAFVSNLLSTRQKAWKLQLGQQWERHNVWMSGFEKSDVWASYTTESGFPNAADAPANTYTQKLNTPCPSFSCSTTPSFFLLAVTHAMLQVRCDSTPTCIFKLWQWEHLHTLLHLTDIKSLIRKEHWFFLSLTNIDTIFGHSFNDDTTLPIYPVWLHAWYLWDKLVHTIDLNAGSRIVGVTRETKKPIKHR